MKIIITIKNNYELEKTDPKRYKKQIKKAERNLDMDYDAKFFGKSKVDLSWNAPNSESVELITHNVEAAKKMFIYFKAFECIRVTVRFESEIVKEENN